MTISSSLNAGVMGLNVNATRLATISDNIANSATNGYKRSEVDFASLVINQQSSAYSAGGVRAETFKVVNAQGALVAFGHGPVQSLFRRIMAVGFHPFLCHDDVKDTFFGNGGLFRETTRNRCARQVRRGVVGRCSIHDVVRLRWREASEKAGGCRIMQDFLGKNGF